MGKTTKRLNLLGKTFGRLTVIKDLGRHPKKGRSYWECLCSCPDRTVIQVIGGYLTSGGTRSCGCLRTENAVAAVFVHGMTSNPAYDHWRAMMRRCYKPNEAAYPSYGGRGIHVCYRWHDPRMFLEDLGEPPSVLHSLDRYPDNNGNYEPGNCRWATAKEQGRNRRSNHLATWEGKTKCLADWAEEYSIPYETLRQRLKRGWSIDRALLESVQLIRKV